MLQSFNILYIAVIGALLLSMLCALIRTIIGPKRADRILGVNMIGSLATAILAILSVYLKENWLLDVCLVYTLMSFLSVVILSKIQISESYGKVLADADEEEEIYE